MEQTSEFKVGDKIEVAFGYSDGTGERVYWSEAKVIAVEYVGIRAVYKVRHDGYGELWRDQYNVRAPQGEV